MFWNAVFVNLNDFDDRLKHLKNQEVELRGAIWPGGNRLNGCFLNISCPDANASTYGKACLNMFQLLCWGGRQCCLPT